MESAAILKIFGIRMKSYDIFYSVSTSCITKNILTVFKMSNKKYSVFEEIEKKTDKKFPKDLEKILLNAGYDSTIVLSIITEKDIEIIENFVNGDLTILNNSSYKSSEENFCFKFKPGHKQLILNLPNLVNSNKKVLTVNNEQNKKSVRFDKDENQLKKDLVLKVANYFEKNSFAVLLDTNKVVDFVQLENKFKCKFLCPLCDVKIGCEFKTYWAISNLQNHIKNHSKKNNSNALCESYPVASNNFNMHSGISFPRNLLKSHKKIFSDCRENEKWFCFNQFKSVFA